jgi:hypothetical protein
MNQGNSQRFRQDDGVWQDGGLLLHYPAQDQWVGIFLAFQSQAWHTDDRTGHAIAEQPETDHIVRIVAALVNAPGPAPEVETVTLLNTRNPGRSGTAWCGAALVRVDVSRWRVCAASWIRSDISFPSPQCAPPLMTGLMASLLIDAKLSRHC